ncbi:MAG: DUF5605 domain-containing protein [Eubacteriales bacterium]|nr:DUF5605 domain-containing protein [Eubacteriales bacterium]
MIQYQTFSLEFQGVEPAGSQSVIDLKAVFTCQGTAKEVSGFYAGNGRYLVRFLPQQTGLVRWQVRGLFMAEGEEECLPCTDNVHHGLVKPDGTALRYEDGTACRPFGTTVYAMMHQPEARIAQTIRAILDSPFDKVRTCVFPKHYIYNEEEPERFAFERKAEGGFDFHRPCFAFWDAFETMLETLGNHGVEADLILFHPYDCWGFSKMTKEEYLPYLTYLLARFAAYPNVWWSLANEYDCMAAFQKEDWDCIDQFISQTDVYGHMLSCHYMLLPYDYAKEQVTHCSVQGDVTSVDSLMARYHKPVLMDEFGYEGNIPCHWGHLSGFELVNRFWICCTLGGYGTHGETFLNDTDTLWWGKGGELTGKSPARIGFLKKIIWELPGALEPVYTKTLTASEIEAMRQSIKMEEQDDFVRALLNLPSDQVEQVLQNIKRDTQIYTGHCGEEAYLAYYGRHCTAEGTMELPAQGTYRVEVIDVWEMTRKTILTGVNGTIKLTLPGKEGIAVLAVREKRD